MYCPKCAGQNLDNARFCRTCGADISFVSQALAGNMPQSPVTRYDSSHPLEAGGRESHKPPSLYKGIRSTFLGVGFILVASSVYIFAPAGRLWWFWLLIPAFANLGSGVAEILRSKHEERLLGQAPTRPAIPPSPQPDELPPRVSHDAQPPSVTEGTTRILEVSSDREN